MISLQVENRERVIHERHIASNGDPPGVSARTAYWSGWLDDENGHGGSSSFQPDRSHQPRLSRWWPRLHLSPSAFCLLNP